MKRRTKIVCTLGPATNTQAKIKELVAAGMNVARLNCSHGTWEEKREWVKWIRAIERPLSPIGILVDLQGPKFRIGDLPPEGFLLKPKQKVTLGHGRGANIPLADGPIWNGIQPKARVLLGDGDIEIRISRVEDGLAHGVALSGGTVYSRKGITVAGRSFSVGCLTPKDLPDIREAIAIDADFLALSYVRSAEDMAELRGIVDEHKSPIRLVSKIETPEALKDLDGIIRMSDAVMVARGDLGLQMSLEDVPIAQKKIIHRCAIYGRPVITATQMLESMIKSIRPTRAEASDVANAIFDGTDAVMLSGETAAGEYPIQAVAMMDSIARKAERMTGLDRRLIDQRNERMMPLATDAVAASAVHLADSLRARTIICSSTSGMTPRLVSRHRPNAPIYCCCWDRRTERFLSLVWGVESVYAPIPGTSDEAIETALEAFRSRRKIKSGDRVVIIAGIPAGQPGHTNLIMVHKV